MILEDLEHLGEGSLFEAKGFLQHFVDCSAADDREVAQVVVVSLEEQRQLTRFFSQLAKSDEVVLCEFAPALVVDVDSPDGVTVEVFCSVQLLHLPLGSFLNYGREGKSGLLLENRGKSGPGEEERSGEEFADHK